MEMEILNVAQPLKMHIKSIEYPPTRIHEIKSLVKDTGLAQFEQMASYDRFSRFKNEITAA